MAKKTFHIEKLTSGYVLTENGKKTAVESVDKLKNALVGEILDKLNLRSTQDMLICLDVEYNLPKTMPEDDLEQ